MLDSATRLVTRYQRPLKFAAVGVVGAAVNTILLVLLIEWLRIDPVLAGAIATELSILNNFVLNDAWTFNGGGYQFPWYTRGLRYNAVASGGWLVSVGTLAFMIHVAGLHPLIANLFALVASFVVNYTANKRFTFMRPNLIFVATDESIPMAAALTESSK